MVRTYYMYVHAMNEQISMLMPFFASAADSTVPRSSVANELYLLKNPRHVEGM